MSKEQSATNGPTPIERAIALLESFAEAGMEATDADGRPTPNARYCLETVADLKALSTVSETAPNTVQSQTPTWDGWKETPPSAIEPRPAAALHACAGLDTADLAGNDKGWLYEVVHDAANVERELNSALRACCAGNTDDSEPVRCQTYEAGEQGSPCPRGCCSMADEKDVRALLAAIEEEAP